MAVRKGVREVGRYIRFQLLLYQITTNSVAQDNNANVLPGSSVVQKWVSRG